MVNTHAGPQNEKGTFVLCFISISISVFPCFSLLTREPWSCLSGVRTLSEKNTISRDYG